MRALSAAAERRGVVHVWFSMMELPLQRKYLQAARMGKVP